MRSTDATGGGGQMENVIDIRRWLITKLADTYQACLDVGWTPDELETIMLATLDAVDAEAGEPCGECGP